MEVGHNHIKDPGGPIIDTRFYFDIFVFTLYGLILLSLFIVPSKKRIQEKEIVHVSPLVLKAHYLLGFIALGMAVVLAVMFYYSGYEELLNIFNAVILLPVGVMLIINSYSTTKLVGEMSLGDQGLVVGEVEEYEEEVVAAKVAPARAKSRAATVKSRAPAVRPSVEKEIMTIQCPGCDKYLKIEYSGEGQEIKCPSCGLEGEL